MKSDSIILVDSMLNLLFAIQLKKTILFDLDLDLAISSSCISLNKRNIIDKLHKWFRKVYIVDYEKCNKFKIIKSIISPEKMFFYLAGEKFVEYKDIYCWNPTLFLYFYLFEMKKRNKMINLHVYGDAMGAYVCDHPHQGPLFYNKFVMYFLKKKYDYKYIEDFEYDYYVINSEYIAFDSKRHIINIPKYDFSESDFKNDIYELFDFKQDIDISNKCILLDVVHQEKFSKSEEAMYYIKKLSEIVAPDKLAIRPHPRQNIDVYGSIDFDIISFRAPWELYACNSDMSGKIIITFGSSSAFLPMIFSNVSGYKVICIDFKNSFNTIYSKEWKKFVELINEKNNNAVYLVNTMDEMCDIVHILFDK